MQVLQIIDSVDRPGGAEQALAAAGPAMVKRGVVLEVAYLLDRIGFQDDLRAAGVAVHAVITQSRLSRVRALAHLIEASSPDLVHTTLFESDIVGRLAARWARRPVVSSLVNVAYGPEHLGDPRLNAWKVRAAQATDLATARGVRRFHAISDHVAGTMARRLRIPRSRIDVIPRGRDPETLATRQLERRRAVRTALAIDENDPMIFAAARHEYQKGLDILVEAMATVRESYPRAALIVAGRFGPQTTLLTAIAERFGVEYMSLLGAREDVPALMGAADIFCAPSRWEGLGSAVVEAMGVGVPIVASDVPAIREAVGSEACARLVRPEDPKALGVAISDTLRDSQLTASRAAAAHQRFTERYTLDVVVDGMLAFYERALSG